MIIEKFKIPLSEQYDSNTSKDKIYLIVGRINGKYGIVDNDENVLLPFEYDNIVDYYGNILLLVKKGKQGIAKIVEDICHENDVSIEIITSCKYDLIKMEDYIAIMQNNCLSGKEIELCFLVNGKKSGSFNEYNVFPYDIIEVKNEHERKIFDWEGRLVLASEPGWEILDVWARGDGYGNCFPIILDRIREEGVEKKRFIYWGGRCISEFRFVGKEIISFIDEVEETIRPSVKNIIINEDCGKVFVLDNRLNLIDIY